MSERPQTFTSRRDFLFGAVASAGFILGAHSGAARIIAQTGARRRLFPVNVSRDRVIRQIVGLRPFRAAGYVVEAQRIGTKLLIHNYGHGGAGITLSWGTAQEAVDLVREANTAPASPRRAASRPARNRFAVIGCGVNGLSTALLLQRNFSDGTPNVTIYAKDLPPNTTSNIAGGYWSPTSAYDSDASTVDFRRRFRAAARISNRAFQSLVGSHYGVRWTDIFDLGGSERELPGGNDLYPQRIMHRDPANYFGLPAVRQFSSMLIEPAIYLRALFRDFYSAGGNIVVREFKSRDEIMRLRENVIFNCTGLGARALFDDQQLIPARGQLEILLPQPEIDYCYLGSGYMFPRSDGIVLGGSFERDNWSLEVNPSQSVEILNTHAEIMKGLS